MARKDFAALESRRAAGASGSSAARDALRSRMGNPTTLRLDEVQANPQNPRYEGDDPEVANLAKTLTRVGQLQPALVVPLEQYLRVFPDQRAVVGQQPWVVIVGNRRLAAARVAGRASLDVRVAPDLETADAFDDRILIENLQREDLPPLLEADHLRRRLERQGETLRSVAKAIGKSHAYVQQRLDLLKLIPELQALLRDGELPLKAGRRLGALPVERQRMHFELGPPYLTESPAESGSGNQVASGIPSEGETGPGNPVTTQTGTGSVSAVGLDNESGSAGSGCREPGGEDEPAAGQRPRRGPGGGNPVSKPGGVSETNGPGERPLQTRLADVLVHVDNALTELDAVLPSGGDGLAGDVLAESQRHLNAARAALARGGGAGT